MSNSPNAEHGQTVLTFEKKRKNGSDEATDNKRAKSEKSEADEIQDDETPLDTKSDVNTAPNNREDDNTGDAKNEDITSAEATEHKTANGSETNNSSGNNQQGTASSKSPESPNIIEKGIIYFLTRGRVGTSDPEHIIDLQRTHFVLRPLGPGTKLGEELISDEKVSRLIAVPKKSLPKSSSDKFMAFVEKAKTNMTELKDDFFPGSKNQTKTMGVRTTPPVTVVGEGVYAITLSGGTSHLAYILAIPSEPGEVQKDLGICEKGSFVLSLKNPNAKGPQNTQLPQTPDFPKDIIDEFNGLRWMPVKKAQHLDYENAQFLLIGEGQGDFGQALESDSANPNNQDDPQDVLEQLEKDEEQRIEQLSGKCTDQFKPYVSLILISGDDTIFDDLRLSKSEYPSLKSTW